MCTAQLAAVVTIQKLDSWTEEKKNKPKDKLTDRYYASYIMLLLAYLWNKWK